MRFKNLKYFIVIIIIVLVSVSLWGLSEKLVSYGGEPDFLSDNDTTKVGVDKEEKEYVYTEQEGDYIDKAAQCVYDFFNENLPDSNVFDSECEVKDLGDGDYCVYVGDWYIFVKGEYDLCYPYKFCKVTKLSEYEMSFIKENNLNLVENGGVYSWEG